ncbi:MAG: diguanylate cyclase [Thermoanaerobaculia bacterium]|nr:diguanylate cyclase [Thermoanaerobaculia bacterium]
MKSEDEFDQQDTQEGLDPLGPVDLDVTRVSSRQHFDSKARRTATLVVMNGPEIGHDFPLRRNEVIIGRGEDADVLLRHREVSRHHAKIEILRFGEDTLYRLTDLGSTNKVMVNGVQAKTHVLVDGDKIHLGDVVLEFELHDAIDSKFHAEVRNRIRYDDLTSLLTYGSFQTALSWELERQSSHAGCAVVMMDLDDFKKLNDKYGHLAGSWVLEEIGALLGGNFRHFDVVSRYGGEEFVSYLPDTELEEALTAVERVRRIIEEHEFDYQGQSIRLTISMGVSHCPDDGGDLETLVKTADERLYRAKREGKNMVVGPEGPLNPHQD